ncbi:MAG: hypothetical protein GF364_04800 [Candidatus Lokiarchaeota archaeon]|nr:hypothetical protein [Candidatus Lokiarchaeota archaeon]
MKVVSNMEDFIEPSQSFEDLLLKKAKLENLRPKIKKIQEKLRNESTDLVSSAIPEVAKNLSKKNRREYRKYEIKKKVESVTSFKDILTVSIPDLAKDIIELEKLKSQFVESLAIAKAYNIPLFDFPTEQDIGEKQLVYGVEPHSLHDITLCSIDGSFVTKRFQGLDITLSRAIGVIYEFNNMGKPKISYFPDKYGSENYKLSRILHNVTEEEVSSQISIERAFMEVQLVNNLISKYNGKIDAFILDGSILTEPLNLLFSQNDDLLEKYLELVKEYKKLYYLCERKGVLLIGSIKDTRSSTFRKLLSRRLPRILKKFKELKSIYSINYRPLMKYFSDIDFFHRLLKEEERSCVFSINSAGNSWLPRQLQLIKKELQNEGIFMSEYRFFATYLKPLEQDFPIRLEFFMNKRHVDVKSLKEKVMSIASLMLPISSRFKDFAMPIPQLEAHLRCKLSNSDIDTIMNILERKITQELMNYSKELLYNISNLKGVEKFDSFLLKKHFLIPKKRERYPL